MKKSIASRVLVIILSLNLFNIAHARQGDNNGGLMNELMSKKYKVDVINDPVKQRNLSKIKFQGQHIQGGLMREMYESKHPAKVINDEKIQNKLRSVKIKVDHDGGLMKEMQDELSSKS